MSDIPLPVIQEFLDQVQVPEQGGQSGAQLKTLWQGTVTAYSRVTNKLTATIEGASIPNISCLTMMTLKSGDIIWGIKDGTIRIALGILNADPAGILAYEKLDRSSPVEPYVDASGNSGLNFTVNTTEANTGLQLVNFPAMGNRLIKCHFKFFAAGPVASGVEWYFLWKYRKNGGSWSTFRETRFAPSGLNAGSPEGEMIFVTDADTQTLGIGLNVLVSSSTATLYQYASTGHYAHSFLYIEDLGRPPT